MLLVLFVVITCATPWVTPILSCSAHQPGSTQRCHFLHLLLQHRPFRFWTPMVCIRNHVGRDITGLELRWVDQPVTLTRGGYRSLHSCSCIYDSSHSCCTGWHRCVERLLGWWRTTIIISIIIPTDWSWVRVPDHCSSTCWKGSQGELGTWTQWFHFNISFVFIPLIGQVQLRK